MITTINGHNVIDFDDANSIQELKELREQLISLAWSIEETKANVEFKEALLKVISFMD